MTRQKTSRSSNEQSQYDVFLSYSRQDATIMQRVKTDLEAEGLHIWIDQTGIEPGTPDWQKAIETAVDNSGCLLVLFSPSAKQSHWVRQEMSYAESQGKKLFFALADGDERTAVPFGYANAQWVDIRTDATYTSEIGKLIAAICKHLGIESISQQRERERLSGEAKARFQAEETESCWSEIEDPVVRSGGRVRAQRRACLYGVLITASAALLIAAALLMLGDKLSAGRDTPQPSVTLPDSMAQRNRALTETMTVISASLTALATDYSRVPVMTPTAITTPTPLPKPTITPPLITNTPVSTSPPLYGLLTATKHAVETATAASRPDG